MNYRSLGFTVLIFMSAHGMQEGQQLEQSAVTLPKELAEIPAEELAIYQQEFSQKREVSLALGAKLNTVYSDASIPAKRDRRLEKALQCYKQQSSTLLYKSLGSFLIASGAGYYTAHGCRTPETTVFMGLSSAGFALAGLKFGHDWYMLAKPTHESIAAQLKQKINRIGYDPRQAILNRINKIFNTQLKKENK